MPQWDLLQRGEGLMVHVVSYCVSHSASILYTTAAFCVTGVQTVDHYCSNMELAGTQIYLHSI